MSEELDDHGAGSPAEPSKTQRKAEARALRDLGQALAGLPARDRDTLDLPETLRDAIERYNATRSHGAKKRELQYLGKQMRRVDPDPIRALVEARAAGQQADAARLHRLERWRDRLIEDDDAVTAWIDEQPGCDVQQLRSLVRAARREGGVGDPERRHGKSYRALFRFLRETTG
jgi:ribosome-associated protein